ncbi:MAG: precorrin-4 C(11)-methyltransferase [Atopobiaceae bacterium]|nr:precorrin-4 C(11)-methyltransferase [Atopobiaceae bacterium]
MIHFVGAGPGAPDLITVRGARLLGSADVIIYAGSLVNPELLSLAPEACEVHDSARMTLEQVIDVMARAQRDGREVVRLHTGDPCLYGAIREQMDALDELGIPYDDTPGVSSLCAAAASLEAEYTLPGVSQSLIVTRLAGRTPVPEGERLSALAAHGASMAIFLSAGMLPQVQEELLSGGYHADAPVALVYKASWPDECVVHTTVGQLASDAEKASINRTALILVGEFLAGEGERSRLYDPSFSTGYRKASHSAGHSVGHSTGRTTRCATSDVRIVSFTDRGEKLAHLLARKLEGTAWRCEPGGLSRWTAEGFQDADGLVFVGAAGIAVRAIAPHVRCKATDPAVVVVDEGAHFALPLLSGHLGGANDLARQIAAACGARPAITTATDGRGLFAVDEWARHQGCIVTNPERIKNVSSRLLADDAIRVCSDWPLPGDAPRGVTVVGPGDACDVLLSAHESADEHALHLVPRVLVLGIGCRRGTPSDLLLRRTKDLMERTRYDRRSLACICSIDAKADEQGLIELAQTLGVPFMTFSADELASIPGTFASSAFVQDVMGVDNVCERSAVLGSDGGTLVHPKDAGDGITLALAERPFEPDWRWTCG